MGCCESIMRVVLGGGSDGAKQELEMQSKTPYTLSTALRGKEIVVLQSQGRPATLSGSGLVLGCAPVEQARNSCLHGINSRRYDSGVALARLDEINLSIETRRASK